MYGNKVIQVPGKPISSSAHFRSAMPHSKPMGRGKAEVENVLVIGPPPEMVGGMAAVVRHMARLQFEGRYRVSVLSQTMSTVVSEPIGQRMVRHLRQVHRLNDTLRRNPFSIVHLHVCSGFSFYRSVLDLCIARLGDCRVVLHVHGAAFDAFHRRANEAGRRIIAWALGRADRVVALSATWAESLKAMSPAAQVLVIENAVDIPEEVPKKKHSGPVRLLLLAKMDVWKGIADLLDACKLLARRGVPFELTLAGPPGSAGDAESLNAQIRERRLATSVRYVGTLEGEAKVKRLRWADLYVQPSHHEGMPLALLEALAYGVPAVATAVGSVPEVVTHQVHGLLVPPHRPELLADAIGRLAADPAHRENLAKAARHLAEGRFSTERFDNDLTRLYDGLPRSPRPAVRQGNSLVRLAERRPALLARWRY